MTEKELGKALLNLDATQLSGGPDARQLTWKILDHDRRRVRMLSGLTICAWIFALIVILLVVIGGSQFPRLENKYLALEAAGKITGAQQEVLQREIRRAFELSTLAAVAVLTLATLCTVFFLFASRRATLRQLNASLVEISEQLKQLRQSLSQ